MTSEQAGATVPAGERRPAHDELIIRVFRALYREFDLHTLAGTRVAVPKGTPWFCGVSLGSIARQISTRAEGRRGPNPAHGDV
jgi:hypothetical protein